MVTTVGLLLGWLLDLLFGDPTCLPHPIVWMGKWIAMGERCLNNGKHRRFKGAVFVLGSIVMLFVVSYILFNILFASISSSSLILKLLKVMVVGVVVFFCLAGHTLRKEVGMVFEAVDRSLVAGRKQVARIVGRDTSELDAQEIRTAALETLAENLSDGVIAPLFWFAVLGVPGMVTYKLINTFDSMIGYKTTRYKEFGYWAAHIDDVANYIPSRLTALLMVLCHGRRIARISKFVVRYGSSHASPNSGWPESALAGILDCRFGGPHHYFGEYIPKPYIGDNERLLSVYDMRTSLKVCLKSETAMVIAVLLCGMV